MSTISADAIAAAFVRAPSGSSADYEIVVDESQGWNGYLAVSRSGFPALIVPVPKVHSEMARITHGLEFRGVSSVEFSHGGRCWREAAAIVECRDARLVHTFSAMVASVLSRLTGMDRPSWQVVEGLFCEWERLLGRRQLLTGESELGLWGELWMISRSRRAQAMLDGWRGPEAERVDFLLDATGFEIKASRRAGVHMVSQGQVGEPFGDVRVVLVSLFVAPDPLRGRSLAQVVQDVAGKVSDVATFEETLASIGYSRDDDAAYGRKYSILERPLLYDRNVVPRVRLADPGVSNIRYRVELSKDVAMTGKELLDVVDVLGIDLDAYGYPCD